LSCIEGALHVMELDLRPAAVWSGRWVFFSRGVCRVCFFFGFVRGCVVRACVVVGASCAGSSGGLASVVPVSVVLAGLLAASSGLAGACPACRAVVVGVRWVARSWGPCVGFAWRAVPPFLAHSRTAAAGPRLRALGAPAGEAQPRGVFKRQRRLAKRAHAMAKGLNQTSYLSHEVRRLSSLYATAQTRSGHYGAYLLGSVAGAPCGLAGLRNRRSPAVLAAGAAPLAGMPTSRQSASRVTRKTLRSINSPLLP
jgi:hypothetical protein